VRMASRLVLAPIKRNKASKDSLGISIVVYLDSKLPNIWNVDRFPGHGSRIKTIRREALLWRVDRRLVIGPDRAGPSIF